MNSRRKLSATYASAELLWYLSREDSITRLEPYCPQYKKMIGGSVTAHGAYGARIAKNIPNCLDQLEIAADLLLSQSSTRQCVITLWRPDDLYTAKISPGKDVPCTLTWQFFVRDGLLHMHVNMRSNDFWLGMPNDIYVNTSIMKMLAATIGIDCGIYIHTIGSLHLYDKDWDKATEAFSAPMMDSVDFWEDIEDYTEDYDTLECASVACELEQRIRCGTVRGIGNVKNCALYTSLTKQLKDAVWCCANKWFPCASEIRNPYLRNRL